MIKKNLLRGPERSAVGERPVNSVKVLGGGRTVSIKDAGDSNVNAVLAMESVRQSFSYTFAFVIASTGSDGVDVTPAGWEHEYAARGCDFVTGLTILRFEDGPPGHHRLL